MADGFYKAEVCPTSLANLPEGKARRVNPQRLRSARQNEGSEWSALRMGEDSNTGEAKRKGAV